MKFNPRTEYHQPLKAVGGTNEETWCDVTREKQSLVPRLFCCPVMQSCVMQAGCVEELLFGRMLPGLCVCPWRQELGPRCPGVEHLDPRRLRRTWMGTKLSGGWCELVSWYWIQGHHGCVGLGFAPRPLLLRGFFANPILDTCYLAWALKYRAGSK